MLNTLLKTYPTVCAVRKNYIICVPVKSKVIMKITVGDTDYYNHANGVKISNTDVHKFTVPMCELNRYKKYTIVYEEMKSRLAYGSITSAPVSIDFNFRPLEKNDDIHIYHLSDVHGRKSGALKAVKNADSDIDLLILNGDIASSSDNRRDIMLSFEIAGEIAKGEIPVIISRGNHDLRGKMAEELPQYMPEDNGKTYYPVSLGALWFVLLDSGEDKTDDHKEYGHTVCCHRFRLDQSKMLEEIKKNADSEYNAPGVKYRIILSHLPFENNCDSECKGERPFDIEREIFTDWCNFARDDVKGNFHLFGHIHTLKYFEKGSRFDDKKIGMPGISGGTPLENKSKSGVAGTLITLKNRTVTVRFNDSENNNYEPVEFTV